MPSHEDAPPKLCLGSTVDLTLALDHGQFIVLDRNGEIDIDAYDKEAQAAGLARFAGGIVVFSESHWSTKTPLRVTLVEHRPALEIGAFEFVVVAGIDCPSGELRIFSPEETGSGERPIRLPPGTYGLCVGGSEFGNTDEYGDNGRDQYQLWLWQTEHQPDREVLKIRSPQPE